MSLKPIYTEVDQRTGRIMGGFGREDFEKIRQGYACPQCWEDFNGVYLTTCPVCGHQRNVWEDFLPTPDHFQPGVAADAPEASL